jgi:prepilin-type N-terminal cleavage/methylation domain-containing protein
MKLEKKSGGFTLVELMIVVAIVAVLSSVAIPKLMSTRLAANENAAISTLRAIAAAQAQLQSSCAIDTDADGSGEFGFLGEMAGMAPLRIWDPATREPGLDVGRLDPPILPTPFGDLIHDDSGAECIVQRAGYYFKVYLPGETDADEIPGVPETGAEASGGQDPGSPFPDADNCEIYWCAYAWPVSAEATGNRVFFINQEGDVLQTLNNEGNTNVAQFYDGTGSVPAYDAAFSNMVGDPSASPLTGMGADLGISVQILAKGAETNDGNIWTVIQGSD